MTLVVANSMEDNIRIISDSKLTSPEEILRGVETSVLKAVILRSELCVCYAGGVGRAQVAIEKLERRLSNPFDLEAILEFLLDEHYAGKNDPDFIVAALSPAATLNKISGGELRRSISSGWIGNYDAFCDYQEHFHHSPLPSDAQTSGNKERFYSLVSKMEIAFREIVQSGAYKDVGEFTISVMRDSHGFKYAPGAYTGFVTQSIPSHTWTALQFGTVANGGYSYSIMTPLEAGIGAIGVHFYQGHVGALFYPVKSAKAIIYRDVSADRFKDKVFAAFGFELCGGSIG